MNTKHYTSIEMSKKLIELGLNPDSADMFYNEEPDEYYPKDIVDTKYPMVIREGQKHYLKEYGVPCWSLGALLEVMPPYLFEFERGIDLNIYRNLNGKGWHVSYMPNNDESMQKDKFRQITNGGTPIEAAYNMVVWLLENGYIKKGE